MPALCTIAELRDILSEHGVDAYTRDFATEATPDEDRSTNAIERADAEVRLWLTARYTDTQMEASTWAKWACARIAVYELSKRRNRPVPQSLQETYDETIEKLRMIHAALLNLPGSEAEFTESPDVTNYTYNGRGGYAKVEHVPAISTGAQPGGVRRFPGPNRPVGG